jgi:glycosidase
MGEKADAILRAGTGTGLATLRPHPHLYQIHTWAWLDALSRAAGQTVRLGDVPDMAWDRLAETGFDIIYLLGMWQRSPAGRHIFRTDANSFPVFDHALPDWTVESVVGSPFSILDYVPDSRIGTWADVDDVRAKLHARGMRLILDFVPNHTGPDHPWIAAHPDRMMQGTEADFHHQPSDFLLIEPTGRPPYFVARGRDPYFEPWADTAQIDYFSESARTALIDVLKTIGSHCDGLRCDMAMLVLNEVFAGTWSHLLRDRPVPKREFWSDAIAALPPDFIWMAEVYWDMEAELQSLGFTYTYDKRLYDRLKTGNGWDLRAHLGADLAYQSRMARFLENHDEPRSAATFGRDKVRALALLIATLPGLRFFHQGQFTGKEIHLPMPLNRARDEPTDAGLSAHYEKVLKIAADPVFHGGEWSLIPVTGLDESSANLIAYRWQGDAGLRVVVINLSGGVAQAKIPVGEIKPEGQYDFADLLNETLYVRDSADLADGGLYVRLDGYQAHVFAVSEHREEAKASTAAP